MKKNRVPQRKGGYWLGNLSYFAAEDARGFPKISPKTEPKMSRK
jgi:hypothetical protein